MSLCTRNNIYHAFYTLCSKVKETIFGCLFELLFDQNYKMVIHMET